MSLTLFDAPIGGRRVVVVASDRTDGDVHPIRTPREVLARRQRSIAGATWTMIDQRHGRDVIDVARVGGARVGSDAAGATVGVADVLVGAPSSQRLAVWAADCAPVVLVGSDATVAMVHAGWRGLVAGVLDVGLDAVIERSGDVAAAVLGPVVHPCCYEFGRRDLQDVAAAVGADADAVSGVTASGATALDVPAAVAHGLARRGVVLDVVGPCTGCDPRWFSHRVRTDRGRHAVVAWSDADVAG